ncbi:thiosulfate sulfurtransferase GlpE [Litoribacillus peritrichatus]|uniref:Thiosulfate sulfurtransferase GlpE n=1 Tax=Litoribacillus peritrichatus TaxID=718191 RepID=A0ABP7LYG9_9GAMM
MFERISPEAAKNLLENEEARIVDIRDPGSFQLSHIPEATLLDNSNIQELISAADMSKPLIVYCYHGNSSQPAAAYLHEQGFERCYSMDGGFEHWRVLYPEHTTNNQ